MDKYTLYVDESETFSQLDKSRRYFIMSGVIIQDNEYDDIDKKLKQIKVDMWKNNEAEQYILHEKDITAAQRRNPDIPEHYKIFKSKRNTISLYNKLSVIFKKSNITTLGVCLDKKQLTNDYGEDHINNQFTIAIQLLIEHYCMFLIENNAIGSICYESMQPCQNIAIQQRIFELKALGTMYYSPNTIQQHIKEIVFIPKASNYTGLQLADFVPNTLGRYVANFRPKNVNFSSNVRRTLYKANCDKRKFGFKLLS